ncbi:MAG: GbsR/MarR family transcriptional regulator [Pseudomonadota bacterium]
MGSRWGIARTVGQTYAVLFIKQDPLCADDLVDALGVSRSNISMSLKELQAWNLVRHRNVKGDRRDFFTTPDDMWQIVRTLIEERKKREIDPTLTKLRELQMQEPGPENAYAHEKVTEMRELIEGLTSFYDELNQLETQRLVALIKMGAKLRKLVTGTAKILPLTSQTTTKG